MKAQCLMTLIAFSLVSGVVASQTPTHTPATPPLGFSFDGSWSCRGTFRSNKQHLSHYEGKTILAGTWTELTEQDSEPATGYVAKYLIGYDPFKKIVVDFNANNSDAQVSTSDSGWVGDELALTSEVMHYPNVPYEQTRTLFRVVDQATFDVDWQVTKTANHPKWVTGDHLTCKHETQAASMTDETSNHAAADYVEVKLSAGQKFGNLFSKTVSYAGAGIDETAELVAGSTLYQVLDASPNNPTFSAIVHYDGHKIHQGAARIQDHGRETCSLGSNKCSPYRDDSGPVYDAFLWGLPTGRLAPGIRWNVQLPVAWEMGPAASQTVTVERVDPADGEIVLRREGEGEGAFADEDTQIKVKKDGKEFTVNVVPGKSHWVGVTVFQRGVTVSDELLMTQSLTVSSKDFGQAVITERQFTLLNQAPPALLENEI